MDNEKLSQKLMEDLLDTAKEKKIVQYIFDGLDEKAIIKKLLDLNKEAKNDRI
jgi:uncharacterized coiled-coil DUF342 family protein